MDTFKLPLIEADWMAKLNGFSTSNQMCEALSKFFKVEVTRADGSVGWTYIDGRLVHDLRKD
jgi:hypothetical protein